MSFIKNIALIGLSVSVFSSFCAFAADNSDNTGREAAAVHDKNSGDKNKMKVHEVKKVRTNIANDKATLETDQGTFEQAQQTLAEDQQKLITNQQQPERKNN